MSRSVASAAASGGRLLITPASTLSALNSSELELHWSVCLTRAYKQASSEDKRADDLYYRRPPTVYMHRHSASDVMDCLRPIQLVCLAHMLQTPVMLTPVIPNSVNPRRSVEFHFERELE